MNSILSLFAWVFGFLAFVTMLLPVTIAFITRQKKYILEYDLALFEIYIYLTFILQSFALVLSYGFGLQNLFIFYFYLPFHTAIFVYLLLKWLLVKNQIILLIVSLVVVFSVFGEVFLGAKNSPQNFMLWFDSVILFCLSFVLSYLNDKNKIHLPKGYNFIHIGIYVYSTITLMGLFPSSVGLEVYGFFLQSIAVIISNYFFARSFLCLFPFRG